jgi:hypothetical protein
MWGMDKPRPKKIDMTKEEFMKMLKRVARKTKPKKK